MHGLKFALALAAVSLTFYTCDSALGDGEMSGGIAAIDESILDQPLLDDPRVYLHSTPPVQGDFDANWAIDGDDFLIWQRSFGPKFDGDDLLAWQASFREGGSGYAATQVPEPGAAVLALILIASAAFSICRRRA